MNCAQLQTGVQTKDSIMIPHTIGRSLAAWTLAAAFLAGTGQGDAALFSYYIGVDSLGTIASGEFAGQANPNHNRLTFLYAHHYADTPASNHYHSKGIYRYQPGSAVSPVIETSPSNYLPEGSAPPLAMTVGTGFYTGKSVVLEEESNRFSQIDLRDTGDLAGFAPGSGEHYMLHSSADRWSGSIAGADVHLVLVSLSSGLHIGSETSFDIGLVNPGDEFHLGEDIGFSPVFWMEGDAAPGTYTASFKLVDESGTFADSGTFEFRFNAVPEPSAAALSLGALALGVMRRKR